MCAGNHTQASQATFGRLKLQDGVQGGFILDVWQKTPAHRGCAGFGRPDLFDADAVCVVAHGVKAIGIHIAQVGRINFKFFACLVQGKSIC